MKEMNEKVVENPLKEDDNFDEAIQIQISKEITTEAYKDNMDKYIESTRRSSDLPDQHTHSI